MSNGPEEIENLPQRIRDARIILIQAAEQMRKNGVSCYEASSLMSEMAGQLMAAAVGNKKELREAAADSARINFFLGVENFERSASLHCSVPSLESNFNETDPA